jgi:DNA-binding PadR family transcriptional regulator
MAYQLLPGVLTEAIFLKRAPYNNPEAIRETLRDAIKAGYLEEVEGGEYKPSQKGRDAIEFVHEKFYDHINGVNQFPAEKMQQLARLLGDLVESVRKAELSSGILSFELVHGGHPEVEAGTLAQVDQFLDDLNAFRDDAHIAAWSPTGVSGQVWEALTFVWNGQAKTAEELVENLPYRNYTEEEFSMALDQLVELGWVEEGSEGYQLTSSGKELREKAEEDTNSFYFNPWMVLSDQDVDLLGDLLTELKETNLKIID